jgi:hypothetical protein
MGRITVPVHSEGYGGQTYPGAKGHLRMTLGTGLIEQPGNRQAPLFPFATDFRFL